MNVAIVWHGPLMNHAPAGIIESGKKHKNHSNFRLNPSMVLWGS